MKQFSLTDWLKDPYMPIRTRDGRPARIICISQKDTEYPIIGLIDNGDFEMVNSFTPNGEAILYPEDDLFLLNQKDNFKLILRTIDKINNQVNYNDFNKNFIITSNLQFIEKFIDSLDMEDFQVEPR